MRYLVIAVFTIFLFSCNYNNPEKRVLGAWKVDSTYQFYNGFDFRQTEEGSDWATYIFDNQGIVKEAKYGTYRPYQYYFEKNKLMWVLKETEEVIQFEMLELNANRMVLKRTKPPVFPGNKQERYEIRYFSRTDPPQDAIELYQPPSQNN